MDISCSGIGKQSCYSSQCDSIVSNVSRLVLLAVLSFIHKPHFIQPDVPFRTAVAPDVELKDKEKRVDLQGQVVLVLSNRQKKCF